MGQNVIHFLVRKKFISFLRYTTIYIICIHIHTHTHQGFSITIDKGLRKNTEKIKDGLENTS